MTAFIQTIRLVLTPLTPIHIGCGLDFEPTNYVIDDDVLYHFDPARVSLSKSDRDALIAAANRHGDEAIRDVQRFFHARKDRFAGVAHGVVSVAKGVTEHYNKRIGQVAQRETGGRRVANQLEIERTAHHPHTGTPYLPGSSIKGAMRTAWLDGLNQGRGKASEDRTAQDMEKRLLDSRAGFHADPFRLLRIADAIGSDVHAKVVFSTNHKKRLVHDKDGRIVEAKGPSTRREVIIGGQYRAISGELRFDVLPGIGASARVPAPDHRVPGFAQLAQACNRYYLKRMQALIEILDTRRLAAPEWLASVQTLLAALKPEFDCGRLMLLRVGRHSGAESVTLDGVRSIRIMKGREQQPDWSPEGAKTVWLAAEHEGERSGMLPFGWLILEPATTTPVVELERWCVNQPKTRLAEVRAQLGNARDRAAAEARRLSELEIERQARERAEAAERAARDAALAELSTEGRKIAQFIESCAEKSKNNRKEPFNPGSGLYAEALALSKAALDDGSVWSADDRRQLAETLAKWLPKVISGYDAKDARKRLKLAALRGE